VTIVSAQEEEEFDWVIFASHADDTLKLIDQPSAAEQEILGCFDYQDNKMVVHCDTSIMPKRKSQWASWHVHVTALDVTKGNSNNDQIHYGFTYWMNNLQNLACKTQIFATLNPNMPISREKVYVERHYRHPVFDKKAIAAQSDWSEINGRNRSSFCGAYWGWGFHEDGARSAERVVAEILEMVEKLEVA
jgi:hypothetical protein